MLRASRRAHISCACAPLLRKILLSSSKSCMTSCHAALTSSHARSTSRLARTPSCRTRSIESQRDTKSCETRSMESAGRSQSMPNGSRCVNVVMKRGRHDTRLVTRGLGGRASGCQICRSSTTRWSASHRPGRPHGAMNARSQGWAVEGGRAGDPPLPSSRNRAVTQEEAPAEKEYDTDDTRRGVSII